MKIAIFASIGAQNLGDELILKNEIKLLEKEYSKDTQFFVFSYDYKNPFFKKSNIKYLEYFPIGIKQIGNLFKNIKNFFVFINTILKSDLIVIGGGGIIYDNEKQTTKNPLDQWIFRTNILRFLKKKIYFFSIGINIKEENNYKKLKKIFSKAYKITTRDIYSHNLLNENGIESTLVKDPVFYENETIDEYSYLIKKVPSFEFSYNNLEDIDLEGKKVALAFRKGYLVSSENKFQQRYEEGKINELINYILSKGGEVILLPHSFHKNDEIANDFLFLNKFLRINEKIRIVNSMEDVYKKYIYKEFDYCLAMRLHSMILSQVYKIPFVGISYSKKTEELLNSLEK